MSTLPAQSVTANGLLLRDVDWPTYGRLLRAFAERPGIRLTYDRGTLEIMAPLIEHDADGDFLGALVRSLTQELGLPVKGGGSVTLRRRKKRRGLEPDRCYWIANEHLVRGKKRLDLRVDPPPDLAIEVDVTRSSLNRMSIYASLGVPEVWRLDGLTLAFYALGPSGTYTEQSPSPTFPQVTPADLLLYLRMRDTQDENTVLRQFQAWVRGRIRPQQPPSP
jgi:Uma2 family endonuclease